MNKYNVYDAPPYYLLYGTSSVDMTHYKIPMALIEKLSMTLYVRLVTEVATFIDKHHNIECFKKEYFGADQYYIKYRGGSFISIPDIADNLVINMTEGQSKIIREEAKKISDSLLKATRDYLVEQIEERNTVISYIDGQIAL
jgi:hypothetical protein